MKRSPIHEAQLSRIRAKYTIIPCDEESAITEKITE
jgi:hypothetical protein